MAEHGRSLTGDLCAEIDRLVTENVRLTAENQRLREWAREAVRIIKEHFPDVPSQTCDCEMCVDLGRMYATYPTDEEAR